jgi:hypothetical protein
MIVTPDGSSHEVVKRERDTYVSVGIAASCCVCDINISDDVVLVGCYMA